MNLINEVEKTQLNTILESLIKDLDKEKDKEKIEKIKEEFFNRDKNLVIGDLVKVYIKIIEGKKERTQIFEGYVIAKKGSGLSRTVKVRKNSFGVGVEKTFLIYSPYVEKFELVRHGRVRRAKLYYLRKLKGKKSQIKEDILA
ncbi:MAG TPA: 50S ribosomal protein L19 [Spirochaetota bacterium]|nr:50S ribosomal protein L19 [Spirochaetota bacterium]HOL56738.1 50S ribosomal protein L19 [Spirochaetota bacterium]HPP04169.1 50S ribosomal protein L19 [Spirochaetota bacterium]